MAPNNSRWMIEPRVRALKGSEARASDVRRSWKYRGDAESLRVVCSMKLPVSASRERRPCITRISNSSQRI